MMLSHPAYGESGSYIFAWMVLPVIVLSCYRVMVIDRFSKAQKRTKRVTANLLRALAWELETGIAEGRGQDGAPPHKRADRLN